MFLNTSVLQIPIFTARGKNYILAENIIRCKAMSNYTCFYTKEKKWVVPKCLNVFEEQLSAVGFVRPNRSELLNVRFIKSIQCNSIIQLLDGSSLTISRRRRKEFMVLYKLG
jgi:DNA-binding LytR/AlgR family response regulator